MANASRIVNSTPIASDSNPEVEARRIVGRYRWHLVPFVESGVSGVRVAIDELKGSGVRCEIREPAHGDDLCAPDGADALKKALEVAVDSVVEILAALLKEGSDVPEPIADRVRSISLRVNLTPEEDDRISRLATTRHVPKATLVRKLVLAATADVLSDSDVEIAARARRMAEPPPMDAES